MALLLMLIIALIAPGLAQDAYYTPCPCSSPSPCPSPCPSPSPSPCSYNPCINDTYYKYDTVFVPFVPNSPENQHLDYFCQRYWPVNDGKNTYNAIFIRTYDDGRVDITTLNTRYNKTEDYFYFATPSCLFRTKYIGAVGIFPISYHEVIAGDCIDCDGSPLVNIPVLGNSPCPIRATPSDLEQAKQLISDSGYGCVDLKALPMNIPNNCDFTLPNTPAGSTEDCAATCYNTGYPNYGYTPVGSYPSYDYTPVPSYPNYDYTPARSYPSYSPCGCNTY